MDFELYQPIFHGLLCLLGMTYTAGQQFNLTRSSEYAQLDMPFVWTCEMFVPTGQTYKGITFFRNSKPCGQIGVIGGLCKTFALNPRYVIECQQDNQHRFTLTIPAENMTEFEQSSVWQCQYIDETVWSPMETLTIAIDVNNVSLIPSDNPLTLSEGTEREIGCVFNDNAFPFPTITWSLGSTDITSLSVNNASSITITGNKMDNGKVLQCRVTNNDKPPKSATTRLNIQYKPEVRSSITNPYRVIEKHTATLVCILTAANPNTGITWKWIKADSPNAPLHNGPNYTIPNIQRDKRGSYSCMATNSVGTSEAVTIDVDVQYKPEVRSSTTNPYKVIEEHTATLVCILIAANPNTGITWKWIKTDSPNTPLYNGPNYTIPNIQRDKSGLYNCIATNSVGTSEAVTIDVEVQYKPEVRSSITNPYKVIEEQTATLVCILIAANPNSGITWSWIKTDSPNTPLHNGPNYIIPNIQRDKRGSYSCTATNSIGTSEAVKIDIDVQYKPSIEEKDVMVVNETERVELTRMIYSNPLSAVSWFIETELLESETSKTSETSVTTKFIIENARCTDTKNFTVVASNKLQKNVTSRVELIVNCKPMPDIRNITLGVSDDTGFAFSTTVIAYPRPRYVVLFGHTTNNNGIWDSMTVNAVNNFTVHLNKTTVKQADYGTYHLNITNSFGGSTIYVNVVPQREPSSPRIWKASCKGKSAKIEWISSFNGGDSQTFFALCLIAQQEVTRSEAIKDRGENKIHNTELLNLQPSTTYVFYVVAKNKLGNSSSDQIKCTTLEDINDQTAVVAGGVGGTLALVILILIIVFLVRRRYTCICYIGFEKRDNLDKANQEASPHYTTMAEQEQSERNIYEELSNSGNVNQYEAVLMKEREENTKVYEKLQHSIDKRVEDYQHVITS